MPPCPPYPTPAPFLLVPARPPLLVPNRLLLTALNVAHGLCSSNSSASSLASTPTPGLPGPASSKPASEAASDALCRLSELLIQLLSHVAAAGAPAAEAAGQGAAAAGAAAAAGGGISPEGAVQAIRTLAALRFNPGGDYTGLLVGGDGGVGACQGSYRLSRLGMRKDTSSCGSYRVWRDCSIALGCTGTMLGCSVTCDWPSASALVCATAASPPPSPGLRTSNTTPTT